MSSGPAGYFLILRALATEIDAMAIPAALIAFGFWYAWTHTVSKGFSRACFWIGLNFWLVPLACVVLHCWIIVSGNWGTYYPTPY